MPSVSDKQHRAMEAAAHGKSTLGIPKKVGQEFASADEAKARKASGGLVGAGKKLVDHGDHFKVHTHSGVVHTIAKKGLHPSTVKHLMKFAEGGTVGYAEGRGPSEEQSETAEVDQNPAEMADRRSRFNSYDPDTNPDPEGNAAGLSDDEEGMKAVTAKLKEANDKQYSEDQYNASMKPDMPGQEISADINPQPSDASVISKADTTNKLPPGGPDTNANANVVTSDNAKLEGYRSAKVHGVTDEEKSDVAAAAAARDENAAKQEALAGDTERVNNDKVKALKDLEVSSNLKLDAIQKRADTLRTDIENGKIDPNHYWHEKGTGGRIMASIGLLLSGLGSGLGGGPNMAMQVIQANIKRDIDAQEKNLETKKSLLADTYRQTGDLRLARQMTEHTLNNVALAQLNTIAAKSSSAQAKAVAAVANAQGKLLLAQQARGIADRQSANDAAAYNAGAHDRNSLMLQRAKAGDALKTPREMQGAKVANINSMLADVDAHLQHLSEGMQGPIAGRIGEAFPWGGADTKANAAAADLLREKLASALGGGVASDARIKQAIASIPGPEATPEQARKGIARVKELLTTQRDEYLAQQSGVGFKTGPQEPVSKPPPPTRKQ